MQTLFFFFFAFTGHMSSSTNRRKCLPGERSSRSHRRSRCSSELTLKLWIHSSSDTDSHLPCVKCLSSMSPAFPSISSNDSECSYCDGNNPAKIYNIPCRALCLSKCPSPLFSMCQHTLVAAAALQATISSQLEKFFPEETAVL